METMGRILAFLGEKSINIFSSSVYYGDISLGQGFSTLALMTFGVEYFFLVGNVCAL